MNKRGLFVALVLVALVGATSMADITAVSWGGAYGAAQKKHMIDPFIANTGINVLFEDYSGGVAEMKAQVESGNIIWDAVDIEAIDLERACSEGLLEVLPFDEFPPGDDGATVREDFYAVALENECGVGNVFWSVVYAYSENTIQGGSPSMIADFFDTETFPGKRALRKRPQVNLEWALLADGVASDEVYDVLATEEGQARAFAKLDSIRDDLVWYESWSQAPQLLNDGGAVMVQSANGRIFSAVMDDGRPFVTVWDGNVYDIRCLVDRQGHPQLRRGAGVHQVRHRHRAAVRHGGCRLRPRAALRRGADKSLDPEGSAVGAHRRGDQGGRHLLGRLRRVTGREVQRVAAELAPGRIC